jgi:site-specific recombinase XerD
MQADRQNVLSVKKLSFKSVKINAEKAGVEIIRVHDLRHSHVSHLIELGFTPVAIAERVGYESIEITLRYAHLFPTYQTEMAQRLNTEMEDSDNAS